MVTRWEAMQAKYGDNDYHQWQEAYASRRLSGGTHAAAMLFAKKHGPPADFACPFGTSEPNHRRVSLEEISAWLTEQRKLPAYDHGGQRIVLAAPDTLPATASPGYEANGVKRDD